jgi:hypothetical protein
MFEGGHVGSKQFDNWNTWMEYEYEYDAAVYKGCVKETENK